MIIFAPIYERQSANNFGGFDAWGSGQHAP